MLLYLSICFAGLGGLLLAVSFLLPTFKTLGNKYVAVMVPLFGFAFTGLGLLAWIANLMSLGTHPPIKLILVSIVLPPLLFVLELLLFWLRFRLWPWIRNE